MLDLTQYLSALQGLHDHLCPRQVLGIRIGLYGASLLNICAPQRMLCSIETDGCFADGVMVATGCSMGHRTMRLVDYGKIAATFVDSVTDKAFRVWPSADARNVALLYAPECRDAWHAQLLGYQHMPNEALLCSEEVALTVSLKALIGRPGRRVTCHQCHEEIINQREAYQDGHLVCQYCAGNIYYQTSSMREFVAIEEPDDS